jgi:TonB-linked SusC/RagA family outer membrane protein
MKKKQTPFIKKGHLFKSLFALKLLILLMVTGQMNIIARDRPLPKKLLVNAESNPATIVDKPSESASNATMQASQVTGVVTDENGNSLPGVNVIVQGTTKGTTTDNEGKFTIEIPEENAVLTFSYIGYLTENISVEGQSVINVTMILDIASLEEVVVIGYGTVKKEDLTGSVAVVTAKDIENMKVATVTEALSAKTPGVMVTSNSGAPGKLPTIRIRGISSLTNAEPLYVIDGVPTNPEDAEYLNPNDIESISVLKDASALAIYGTRAANGIIEITTKKGRVGDMKVNYSAYYGKQTVVEFPDMMDAYEFAYIFNEVNQLYPGDPLHLDSTVIPNTNWFEEMTQDAPMQNHYLSISGGNEKTTYALSAGLYDQTGIIKNTYLKRYNIRLNTNTDVKKWLKVGQSISFTKSEYKGSTEGTEWGGGQFYESMMAQPIIKPYDDSTGLWSINPYSDAIENPMINVDRNFRIDKNYYLNGNMFVELKPITGLTFKSLVGYNLEFVEGDEFRPTYQIDVSNRQLYPYLYKEFNRKYWYSFDNTATYEKEIGDHSFKLMAGTSVFEVKSYNLTGTQNRGLPNENEVYRFFEEYDNQQQYDLIITDSARFTYSIELFENVGGSTPSIDRLYGYLGRLEYGYKNRYLFTANLRIDGSSNFGPEDRIGIFPGFAAAWKIHQESFMSNIGFISQLKLRLGWGKIGNDRIPKFEYLDLMNTNMGYSWGGNLVSGASPTKPANPVLHWEESVTTNIGLDLSIMNNKLNLIADVYRRLTDGMLWNPELPSVSGITPENSPNQNLTSMVNKGIELALNYRQREGNFKYEAGGYIAINRIETIELANDGKDVVDGSYANRRIGGFVHTREGYPVGMFYGYKVEGIFQSEEDIAMSPYHGRNTQPGDLKFKDLNGDNIINPEGDMTFIGDPHPDFTYGLTLNLEYMGFDLGASFKGVYGHDIFVAYKGYSHNYDNPGYNFHRDVLDRWSEDNTETEMFAYNPKSNKNLESSDFYLEDGSFLRLQNLQFGYTVPERISGKLTITRFRIYISAQNLKTWSKYLKYGDPDIGPVTTFYNKTDMTGDTDSRQFSIDQIRAPIPRLICVGLDLSF